MQYIKASSNNLWIDFNGMSYRLGLFYTWWSGNCVFITNFLLGLQDTTQYSGQSQQCGNLDDLDSSADFQITHSPFKALGYHFKSATIHIAVTFSSSVKVQVSLFAFFDFHYVVHWYSEIYSLSLYFAN